MCDQKGRSRWWRKPLPSESERRGKTSSSRCLRGEEEALLPVELEWRSSLSSAAMELGLSKPVGTGQLTATPLSTMRSLDQASTPSVPLSPHTLYPCVPNYTFFWVIVVLVILNDNKNQINNYFNKY